MNFLVEVDDELDFNEVESPLMGRRHSDQKSMRSHVRPLPSQEQNRSFISPREEGEAYSEDENDSVGHNIESRRDRIMRHTDREEGEASSEDERRFERDLRHDKKAWVKYRSQFINSSNTTMPETGHYPRSEETLERWKRELVMQNDVSHHRSISDHKLTSSKTQLPISVERETHLPNVYETIEQLDTNRKYQPIKSNELKYKQVTQTPLTTTVTVTSQNFTTKSDIPDPNAIDALPTKHLSSVYYNEFQSTQIELSKRKLKSKKSKRDRKDKDRHGEDKNSLTKQRRKEAKHRRMKSQQLADQYCTEWEPAQKLLKSNTNHHPQTITQQQQQQHVVVTSSVFDDELGDINRMNSRLSSSGRSPSLLPLPPPAPAPPSSSSSSLIHSSHRHYNRKQIHYNEDDLDVMTNTGSDNRHHHHHHHGGDTDADEEDDDEEEEEEDDELESEYSRTRDVRRTSGRTRSRLHYRRETRESAPPPESNRSTNYANLKSKYSNYKVNDRKRDHATSGAPELNNQASMESINSNGNNNKNSWFTSTESGNKHSKQIIGSGKYSHSNTKQKFDTEQDTSDNNLHSTDELSRIPDKLDLLKKTNTDPLSLISNRKIQEQIRSRYDSFSESDDDDDDDVDNDDVADDGVDNEESDLKLERDAEENGANFTAVDDISSDHLIGDELIRRRRLDRSDAKNSEIMNTQIELERRMRAELSDLQNLNLVEAAATHKRVTGKPFYYPSIQGCRSVEEFECLNRIEEGTYGVVYRARDKKINEIVALKRLKMEKERDGFPITSLREINTLMKAQHENIVTVREVVVGSNMDKIYLVMDYVEHDLKSLMEIMNGPFSVGEVKCLLVQLLRAVSHLHDNWILHRDLKTSNLLLSHHGILKVGDFGLAREYGSPLKHYTEVVVTLWYRAPELLLGAKQYACPIDLWSVGCIFAEFLLQRPLFPGKGEVDELNIVFRDLGTPTERIWPGVSQLPGMKKCVFTEYPYNQLRRRFTEKQISDQGFDLLNSFLTYCPEKRVTAEKALGHPYFNERPRAIHPSMFPSWPAKSEGGIAVRHASPRPPAGGGALAAAAAAVAAAAAAAQSTAPNSVTSRITYQPPAPPMGGQRFYSSMGDSHPSTLNRTTLGSGEVISSNVDKGFLLRF